MEKRKDCFYQCLCLLGLAVLWCVSCVYMYVYVPLGERSCKKRRKEKGKLTYRWIVCKDERIEWWIVGYQYI
jgi:hypothetical protein